MRVKHISISNFLGITELTKDLGKINHLTGHKGSGKTSLVEAIQKGFTNKSERTEIVRHGEEEATIFIQTDTGLEVDRRIRIGGKADYLKIKKPGEAVPSSEKFLRQFINGDIFKPLEFVNKTPAEQAKIILNLLEIPWTMNDIKNWFGETPDSVNYHAHILQVLAQIVTYYFDRRAAVNQEIAVLKAQIKGYKDQLPPNYDGEYWRSQKVSEYYGKVAEAEEFNKKITAAQNLIAGVQDKIEAIKANAEFDKQSKKNVFDQQRSEGREFIQFLNQKIERAQATIDGAGEKIEAASKAIDQDLSINLEKSELEYQRKLQELAEKHKEEVAAHRNDALTAKGLLKKRLDDEVSAAKEDIAKCKSSLAAKEQSLMHIDELEEQSLKAIDEKTEEQIKVIHAEVGNSEKFIKTVEPIDIEPLKKAADEVADMQSYLRDFELMTTMIREKLAPKEELSKTLTQRIEKGRELPMELLKIASLPIPGIKVDSDGLIRIGETLIDGLSEGEQLELAFRVAKAQAGELKLICLDGWNKINPKDREWIEREINEDDFQYIILSTEDGDLNVKIEGEI